MADARVATGARLAVVAAGMLCLAWGVAAVVTVEPGGDRTTTYAAASAAARFVDAAAGFGLLAAGLLACTQPRMRRIGMLALLAGAAWFGADWEGAEGASELLRSVGMVLAPFLLPSVLHLALAFPGGRARSRGERGMIVAAYGVAAAGSLGLALFRDPLLDLYCWRNCSDNSFLVHADPGLASTVGDAWLWSALAIATVLVVVAARRLVSASRPARRALRPLLGPAILVGLAEAAYVVVLLDNPLEDPNRGVFAAVFVARAVSLIALATGIAWCALSVTRTRSRVARLASELGEAPAPGRLREALAAALGDPDLEVLYPHGGPEGLIDAEGRRAVLAVDGRAVTRITRGGRTRALVVHDSALVDEPVLERELGASARLAVENEALRAEALAQLAELSASRARIVEAGDSARRRLERNLHDGAQQQLLALSYDLRLALGEARGHHDAARTATLDAATRETAVALQELRDLAHGIHPAILTEAGLGPALATLADEAPLPVELGDVEPRRYPPAVETTAYAVVVETIEDAARRRATFLAVRVEPRGDRLAIEADDDGESRTSAPLHLADRVGALGGSLERPPTGLRVELPCG